MPSTMTLLGVTPYLLVLGTAWAIYFLFSAAVGAMWPPTDAQKPRFYGWLYRFLQRLAANADRLAEAHSPGLAALAHSGDGTFVSSSASFERTDVAVSNSK